MYRFDCNTILLNGRYRLFKSLKDIGFNYSDIAKCTGYTRQYVRGLLVKYKY